MRILIVLLCLLAVSASCAAPARKSRIQAQRDVEAKALTALIKKNLPPGWAVVYQPEYPGIRIKRLKPTAIHSRPIPSMSAPDPNRRIEKPKPLPQYQYFLRIEEFLTVADYQKIKAVNTDKEKEMTKLVSGLIWGKGYYIARNAEEEQRVQRYEKLEESLYDLPDYYWGHLSFEKIDIMNIPEYDLVVDDKVREECKRVTLIVLGLLTPYEKAISSSAKAKN